MNTIPIVLADDDEDDRLIFQRALEKTKHATNVKTFHNGVQLMDYLNTLERHEMPHILFLDLNMPLKNGVECLCEIRSSPMLQQITVAIYSTSASDDDIERTFVQGANVYIRKPNDFNTLVQVLTNVLNINWQYQNSELNKENFVLSI